MFYFRKRLKADVEDLQIEFKDLNELYYRLSNKIDNLFQRDNHETLRPKVDLLDDSFSKSITGIWNGFEKLQERIIKLEGGKL